VGTAGLHLLAVTRDECVGEDFVLAVSEHEVERVPRVPEIEQAGNLLLGASLDELGEHIGILFDQRESLWGQRTEQCIHAHGGHLSEGLYVIRAGTIALGPVPIFRSSVCTPRDGCQASIV
jgi:hypothetical protein